MSSFDDLVVQVQPPAANAAERATLQRKIDWTDVFWVASGVPALMYVWQVTLLDLGRVKTRLVLRIDATLMLSAALLRLMFAVRHGANRLAICCGKPGHDAPH